MKKRRLTRFWRCVALSLLVHAALFSALRFAPQPSAEAPRLLVELSPKPIPPTIGAVQKKPAAKKARRTPVQATTPQKKPPAALVENPLTHQRASQWKPNPTAEPAQQSRRRLTLPDAPQRQHRQRELSALRGLGSLKRQPTPPEKTTSRFHSATAGAAAKNVSPLKNTAASAVTPAGSKTSGQASLKGAGGKTQTLNWRRQAARTLLSYDPLQMPAALTNQGIKTKAVLQFKVAPQGRPYHLVVLKSSGYAALDQALRQQVRSFVFNAITENQSYEAELEYVLSP